MNRWFGWTGMLAGALGAIVMIGCDSKPSTPSRTDDAEPPADVEQSAPGTPAAPAANAGANDLKSAILGQWESKRGKPGDAFYAHMELIIRSDGSAIVANTMPDMRQQGKTIVNRGTGKWTMERDQLLVTVERLDNGEAVPAARRMLKLSFKQNAAGSADDTLTAAGGQGPNYTRKGSSAPAPAPTPKAPKAPEVSYEPVTTDDIPAARKLYGEYLAATNNGELDQAMAMLTGEGEGRRATEIAAREAVMRRKIHEAECAQSKTDPMSRTKPEGYGSNFDQLKTTIEGNRIVSTNVHRCMQFVKIGGKLRILQYPDTFVSPPVVLDLRERKLQALQVLLDDIKAGRVKTLQEVTNKKMEINGMSLTE